MQTQLDLFEPLVNPSVSEADERRGPVGEMTAFTGQEVREHLYWVADTWLEETLGVIDETEHPMNWTELRKRFTAFCYEQWLNRN